MPKNQLLQDRRTRTVADLVESEARKRFFDEFRAAAPSIRTFRVPHLSSRSRSNFWTRLVETAAGKEPFLNSKGLTVQRLIRILASAGYAPSDPAPPNEPFASFLCKLAAADITVRVFLFGRLKDGTYPFCQIFFIHDRKYTTDQVNMLNRNSDFLKFVHFQKGGRDELFITYDFLCSEISDQGAEFNFDLLSYYLIRHLAGHLNVEP